MEEDEKGWVTCNTDGASKGSPSMSSYGFCIRNSDGDLIYAKAHNLGIATNMKVKSIAILKAVKYCLSQNFLQIHLETDFLGLKIMIREEWRVPWMQKESIEEIKDLMLQLNIHINHTFRNRRRKCKCKCKYGCLDDKTRMRNERGI